MKGRMSKEDWHSPDLKKICQELPKYNYEQKVVQKALSILGQIGEPRFSVSKNCWETNLKRKDESRLWYARGLLESLLFNERIDNDRHKD